MRGVVLSGLTGSGKTTVQQKLVSEYGGWTPRSYTTREVANDEADTEHIDDGQFQAAVRTGRLVLPQHFGGSWYGWDQRDLAHLKAPAGLAVLNVRPYTALVISALFPDIIPVWLDASRHLLEGRRLARNAPRDAGRMGAERDLQDHNDEPYAELFRNRVPSNESAASAIMQLLEVA